ncbi:Facilitated trehalose transporter Tret1 [Folsomia candida]|uniref:Facilitated trehalose transporter Tret1 n=2 Tax=Folsomia candida TaxID=158441 RepID=A0A226EYE3_FOLCA|nr:Facilitated trehalose transporter Tret1 [Folsomia candida]
MERDLYPRSSEASEHTMLQFHGKSRPQIIASLVATFGTFCSGTVLAWTSTVNPQLKETKDIGNLTDSNLSLIASIAVIGALISGAAAGFSIDKIGRRLTIILLVIPFILGWGLVAFAQDYAVMLVGRFITGFCAGAYTLVVPVYISEVTQDRLRGAMSNCMVVTLVSGILFSYVLGALVPWKWLSIISGILPIFLAIAMFFIPDSPRYQVVKGMQTKAAESLRWLRGVDDVRDIDDELKELQHSVQVSKEASGGSLCDILKARNMKPLAICLVLMIFQQFGGINAVIFFTVDIFKASGSDINPNVASIIVGSVQVVCVIVSTLLVDRMGRKVLMFISETGMAVSLAALGVFFYLKHDNHDQTPENLGWLPLLSMILYIITYNLG